MPPIDTPAQAIDVTSSAFGDAPADRLTALMRQSEQCAHELAEALERHDDENTIRALQERFENVQRAWKEEALRVKEHPDEA